MGPSGQIEPARLPIARPPATTRPAVRPSQPPVRRQAIYVVSAQRPCWLLGL